MKKEWHSENLRYAERAKGRTAALLALCLLLSACGSGLPAAGTAAAAVTSAAQAPAPESAEKPGNEESAWSGLSFTTQDLAGNQVTAEELFSSHEITMVNNWTTWCPYCIREFPALEKLNAVLAEKDCAVVGICRDVYAPVSRTADEARELLKETGVTYPNLVSFKAADEYFPAQAVPVTYFVDRGGNIIGEPVVGARIDAYLPAVEALLSEMLQ